MKYHWGLQVPPATIAGNWAVGSRSKQSIKHVLCGLSGTRDTNQLPRPYNKGSSEISQVRLGISPLSTVLKTSPRWPDQQKQTRTHTQAIPSPPVWGKKKNPTKNTSRMILNLAICSQPSHEQNTSARGFNGVSPVPLVLADLQCIKGDGSKQNRSQVDMPRGEKLCVLQVFQQL